MKLFLVTCVVVVSLASCLFADTLRAQEFDHFDPAFDSEFGGEFNSDLRPSEPTPAPELGWGSPDINRDRVIPYTYSESGDDERLDSRYERYERHYVRNGNRGNRENSRSESSCPYAPSRGRQVSCRS